jgi:thioredoxin-dependent peroxiredoxin
MSMDLPFAIERFCASERIEKAIPLSDHRDASFGNSYGVLIKKLRLLAHAIFVIDRDDVIRYMEIVPQLTNHPDYEKALEAVKKLLP